MNKACLLIILVWILIPALNAMEAGIATSEKTENVKVTTTAKQPLKNASSLLELVQRALMQHVVHDQEAVIAFMHQRIDDLQLPDPINIDDACEHIQKINEACKLSLDDGNIALNFSGIYCGKKELPLMQFSILQQLMGDIAQKLYETNTIYKGIVDYIANNITLINLEDVKKKLDAMHIAVYGVIKKNITQHYGYKYATHQILNNPSRIFALLLTPNSNHIISGSEDGNIRIWDRTTGVCSRTLQGHTNLIHCLLLTKDSNHIISGSFDETIRIWDIATGTCLQTLKGHENVVLCLALTKDNRIISGLDNGNIRIWDSNSGECLRTLQGHEKWVKCLALTEDNHIISGSGDETIRIWDSNSGECLRTLKGHRGFVFCLALTGDNRIISGACDKTIRIWDVSTGACLQILRGHRGGVRCLVLTHDNTCIISGSEDEDIRIWDIGTGTCLQTLKGHGPVGCLALTQDNSHIISGLDGETICVWQKLSINALIVYRALKNMQSTKNFVDTITSLNSPDMFKQLPHHEREYLRDKIQKIIAKKKKHRPQEE